MMTQGEGGPKDDEAAVQRFRQASSMGYKRGTYNLAIMYDKGAGVPRDIEKAKQLYKQAGTPEAQTRLEQLNAPVGPGGFRKK